MAADASIYGLLQQPKQPNPLEMFAQAMKVRGLQQEADVNELKANELRTGLNETNALRRVIGAGGFSWDDPAQRNAAFAAAPTKADALYKTHVEGASKASETQKRLFDIAKEGYSTYQREAAALFDDPQLTREKVAGRIAALTDAGVLRPEVAQRMAANLPQDVNQLRSDLQAALKGQLTPEQMLTAFAPKPTEVNNGQEKFFTDTNPNSPTYGQRTAGGGVKMKATPGEELHAATSVQTTKMNNDTSRAINAATIAKDFAVAGVTPDGGLDANAERTAQAIAAGQLPAPTGMALLNPKNQRILGRVMEINPQYDATTVAAKKAAAVAFTTGKEGATMRSLQVASQHLDQLGELADAMNNGNMQLVNKIANAYSQQTGSPAVANFDAAKQVVAKEVIKAIVAGGGGVEERAEVARILDNAKSPAQLKGAITQFRNLMGAQHEALLVQRRAAGLPDSTLPKYTDANGSANAPAVPPDIAAILERHGGK